MSACSGQSSGLPAVTPSASQNATATKPVVAPNYTNYGGSAAGGGGDNAGNGAGGSGGGCPPNRYIVGARGIRAAGCGGGSSAGSVATAKPAVGLPCDNSPQVLGTSNLPGGTNGASTSVTDIESLQNSSAQVAGWFYETENGKWFFQGNPGGGAAWAGLVGDMGSSLLGYVDTPRQVSAGQMTDIESANGEGGFHVHACFSGPLPASSLG